MKKYLIFCIGLALIISCNQKTPPDNGEVSTDMVDNNPATASGKAAKGALPIMKFEKDTHDFGKLTEGEIVTYSFKFTNTGKGPLVIANASASCGCTVPRYSEKPVQPGEVGFLDVTFNSANKEGPMEKTVTVIANTIPERQQITILADVRRQQ
jgi:hypothetical protein